MRKRASRSIGGPVGPGIQVGGTRRGSESRCHNRILRDNPDPATEIPSSIPGIPAATPPSSLQPLSIGRWRTGQGATSVARSAVMELMRLLQLAGKDSGNSASRVPGAGRATGAAPVTNAFDRSAKPSEALECKGYRGASNSTSTLRQLYVKGCHRRFGSSDQERSRLWVQDPRDGRRRAN